MINSSSNRFLHYLYLSVLSTVLFLGACKSYSLDKAKEEYDKGYYATAAQEATEVSKDRKIDKESKNKAYLLAAESYRMSNDYKNATKYFDKYLKYDPKNTDALLHRADCLKSLEKDEDAVEAYTTYLQEVPGDSFAIYRRKGLEMKLTWDPDSSRYKVENFKEANTKASDDWAPMIAARRDKLLYLASDRAGGVSKKIDAISFNTYSDIWFMEKTTKRGKVRWSKPQLLKEASTKYNDGALAFNTRFSNMFMTQCNGLDGKGQNCMIYAMKKIGKDWLIQDPLSFCTEDSASFYGHPTLSADGSQMFFSSDREGGYGGFDLWVSNYTKRGKTWSDPVNLGPNINTAGNEYYPFFNKGDNKLYFSSDGWPGAGGLDIFKIDPTDDVTVWKKLQNLKLPMNSGGDDLGITFNRDDPNSGYFSSNRGAKRNNFDIYKFYIEPCSITLEGVITDCETTEPIPNAIIRITNDKDTSVINLTADAKGRYDLVIEGDKNFRIEVSAPTNPLDPKHEYYFAADDQKVSTLDMECGAFQRNFCMENPIIKLLTLPIYYDLDKAFIRPDAEKVLDDFAKSIMLKYPKLYAELGSHTDCRASMAHNEDLATRRAKNAVDYLVSKWKIDSARITWKGYGEKELVNNCACEPDNNAGLTPYIVGKTRKMVEISEGGLVTKTYYEDYDPSEIITEDGKLFVNCDEFQHRQNRRTTVLFSTEDIKSTAKITQNVDANNAKVVEDSAKKAVEEVKPVIDISYAAKARVFKSGGKQYISGMINKVDAQKFRFEPLGRYTAVTKEVAAEWYSKKMINKGSFVSGGDKIRVGKVKLPSNSFVVDELDINGYIVKRARFKVLSPEKMDGADALLGRGVFRNFKPESYIEGDTYFLIPKRKPRAPRPPRN